MRQATAVINRTLESVPVSNLFAFDPAVNEYLDAFIVEVGQNPENYQDIGRTLQHLFGTKFLGRCPNWKITELQKIALVDRIFKTLALDVIARSEPQDVFYRDALLHETRDGCFKCQICMDSMVTLDANGALDTSKMWFASLRKTEHWSNNPCGHAFCRSCIAQWAETAINGHKTSIRCPVPKCLYKLWDQDLAELVNKKILKRHQEHSNADYLAHLKKSIKKDAELKSWLQSHARPCPTCHVIVSRSDGCNVMVCVCGMRFCYQCGFKDCLCRTDPKYRPDIWKPR